MRYWMLGTVAFAALLLGLGEVIVCMTFLALPLFFWRTGKPPLRVGSLVVAAAGLFLHWQGYKLFGSAKVVTTPQLQNAVTAIGVEPPDRVRLADGKTTTLEGIYFPQAVDLTVMNERNALLWHLLEKRSERTSFAIRVLEQGSRAECLRRNVYWCGNTFFPAVLPRRLPSHTLKDFGSLLVRSNLAIPRGGTGDRAYEDQLLEAFDRSVEWSLYPARGLVKRGDEVAVALGTLLIHSESRRFVAGAYLLIAAQNVEAYSRIEREIRRRQQRNRDDYDAIAQCRSSDLDALLAWIDVDEARGRMSATPVPSISSQMDAGSVWGANAAILASHGELSGFDQAVRAMGDEQALDSGLRAFSDVIPRYFKWPMESPMFSAWYATVRPQLRTGRDELGCIAFWLDGETPFGDAYHHSIEQITARR